jgi:hypothetical protein
LRNRRERCFGLVNAPNHHDRRDLDAGGAAGTLDLLYDRLKKSAMMWPIVSPPASIRDEASQ